MASWVEEPKPEDTDALAYAEAWENRIPDVEWADEDEAGQLGLGVPGDQRALPGLAKSHDCETAGHVWSLVGSSVGRCIWCGERRP